MNLPVNQQRAQTYGFFALLLSAPISRAHADELSRWNALQDNAGFMQPLLRWLAANREGDSIDGGFSEQLLETCHIDYTTLLTGIRRDREPSPPYASLFTGRDFTLNQSQARLLYRQYRVEVSDPYGQQSDHIVCLLQLMAHLCQQDRTREQVDVIRTHLLPWLPAWLNELQVFRATSLYSALAQCLVTFIEEDIQNIALADDHNLEVMRL